jgi:hypothetical protein
MKLSPFAPIHPGKLNAIWQRRSTN